jgi:hypothetical protein
MAQPGLTQSMQGWSISRIPCASTKADRGIVSVLPGVVAELAVVLVIYLYALVFLPDFSR